METTELGFTVLPKGYEVASQTGRTFASANKRTVPIGKFFCKHLANDEGNAPFNQQKSSILTAEQQTDLFHGRFKEAVQLCDECYRNYNAFTAGGYEGLRKQVELEKLADETPAGSAAGIDQETWALAFMSGFMAAKVVDDAGPDSPAKRAAEKEGLEAMQAKPFWGPGNVKAYHEAKKKI
jgi:hypothetical protein